MPSEKRLYRNVQQNLQSLIDSGEYPTGGRLPPERELAERFGVSRPTVREAIIALEALGQVEVKTGSGVYVLASQDSSTRVDRTISAFELTEARALIEGEGAALAATMITDEQLTALEGTLARMADESENAELISEQADQEFHRIIAEATRNAMIISVFNSLWNVRDNSPEVHAAYQAICEDSPQARVREHVDILDALKSREPAAARQAMHSHFGRILGKLIAASEKAQLEEIRKKTQESRERFSLGHLAGPTNMALTGEALSSVGKR
ncbi:MAG: FadR/GntR family transcriptional regulator [Pseudomonadota bacterium]